MNLTALRAPGKFRTLFLLLLGQLLVLFMSDQDTLNVDTRCAAVACPSSWTSIPAGACRFLPGLVFIFPPCSQGHQWVVLDQSCSRTQEKLFSSRGWERWLHSVAGSVSGISIPLCSPHLALLEGAYFYPYRFILLHCPCGGELHPRKGSLMSGSEVLLLLESEQGCRFSSPIGVR